MQETKTNALGIRITDGELRRLEAIKSQLGLPSMTNTTLGHDLLIMGMQQMETRAKADEPENQAKRKAVRKRSGEKPLGQPAEGVEV